MTITAHFWYSRNALTVPEGTKADLCLQIMLPLIHDAKVRATDCIMRDGRWLIPTTESDPNAIFDEEEGGYFGLAETPTIKVTHFMIVRLPV